MDYLNFNNMDDDSFRKDFLNFLNQHQKRMSDFMKRMYDEQDLNSNETFNNIISKINRENTDTYGEDDMWGVNKRDSETNSINYDSINYDSFLREFNPYKEIKPQSHNGVTTMELLESKLNKAVMKEDYESAIKIRDLMKSLSEG